MSCPRATVPQQTVLSKGGRVSNNGFHFEEILDPFVLSTGCWWQVDVDDTGTLDKPGVSVLHNAQSKEIV